MNTKKFQNFSSHDQQFIQGFYLYLAADKIIDTHSWQEMLDKIGNMSKKEEIKSILFSNFKAFNFIILIEASLCSFFYCHQKKFSKMIQKLKL